MCVAVDENVAAERGVHERQTDVVQKAALCRASVTAQFRARQVHQKLTETVVVTDQRRVQTVLVVVESVLVYRRPHTYQLTRLISVVKYLNTFVFECCLNT